ncbi:hypothetical protein FQA39_LY05464 [Lamprigera yunnana]|nr:hypothetical protein FQA39_LY05464 [Lamprigera yunnana]
MKYRQFVWFVLWFTLSGADDLKCVPPSCAFDVVESEDYTFGFEKNQEFNITNCVYKSDTGISGTFDVRTSSNTPLKHNNNKKKDHISDSGALGYCHITVSNAGKDGPRIWTLEPFHHETSLHQAVNFTVNFFHKLPLLSNKVNVIKNEGFYQYFNVSSQFSSCRVKFNETEFDLDLVTERFAEGSNGRMKSLGDGLCGFSFSNVSANDPTRWTLTAVDTLTKQYRSHFDLGIYDYPPAEETHVKQYVKLGLIAHIECGNANEQEYCYLYNPRGKFIKTSADCSYSIKTLTLAHIGRWTCKISKYPATHPVEYVVELIVAEGESPRTWITESDHYIQIGCQLINHRDITGCRMTSPNKDVLNLRPGVVVDHYSSMGTDYKNSTCSLRVIEKPLRNSDKGQWKCEMHITGGFTGGFIYLADTKAPQYQTNTTITAQIGDELKIECSVPYSSEYCYVQSPNGTEYLMQNNQQSRLGSCSVIVPKLEHDHVGYWNCFFARDIGVPDERISVEVRVAEVLLNTNDARVTSGENASLLCSSHGFPLKYCRFISPNSSSYFIHNHRNSNRLSYNGRGLEYGECGITITNAQPSDSGVWNCIMKVGGDYTQDEISAKIDLYVAPTFLGNPITAIAFGTAVGVIIIAIVGFFVAKKWKAHRTACSKASGSSSAALNEEISDPNDSFV